MLPWRRLDVHSSRAPVTCESWASRCAHPQAEPLFPVELMWLTEDYIP